MKDPQGVSPSKGNQGTTRGNSWVQLALRFPPRSKDFFFTSCGSLIPFTRANAQWVILGLNLALKFTLQS